ncbi:hypothetical protein SCNU_15509 [Gordonia neofelifaecis NRRL B-59395]|uniref:DUF4328 domain-containing protein n=2 Tax=Gordonia TaxID=2053 RepID=F1YM93_9ACTN|nr:hypothetical protein SCNU_15509 [Gordonia neofelifaecis NRRL B-59395]
MLVDEQGRVVPAQQQRNATPPRPQRVPLRWVADRPVEARPTSAPVRVVEARPTPFYRFIPRWGLSDVPPVTAQEGLERETPDVSETLSRTLRLTSYMLAAAAVAHLIRYLIAVVNRSTPIPMWLDLLSGAAVLVFGVFAFVAMLVSLVAFVRWLIPTRAEMYRAADRRDPRPTRNRILLAALPLVNVVGAPLLLTEAALSGDRAESAVDRIKRLGLAWALVNVAALVAVGYRIAAWTSDSVQVSADALAVVTFSLAVSAVFAHWVGPRLITVLTGPIGRGESQRRLVVA